MKSRLAILAVFSAGLLVVSACRSWFHSEQWQDMDAEYEVQFPILWNAVKLTLIEEYETLEHERSADGELRTGWVEYLSYLAGSGYREKAFVRVVKGAKGYRIYVRVARETNEEPIYTMESKNARWELADDNAAGAQHLVGLIHIKLKSAIVLETQKDES